MLEQNNNRRDRTLGSLFFCSFLFFNLVARLQTERRRSARGHGGELDRAKCMSRSAVMYLCVPMNGCLH